MIHPVHGLSYFVFITREIVSGALTLAVDAFTPGSKVTPMIVEYPLECSTDSEITLMASSITITPGTLTVGIAPAGEHTPPTLYVHSMYTADRADTIAGLRDMEQRLLRMTRGSGGRT
jgi:multicomponent Na+:H+ antiporter subunit E